MYLLDGWNKRLREIREKSGLSQSDFALLGGVKKQTQISYEQEKSFPDIKYLMGIEQAGMDVRYILTGVEAMEYEEKKVAALSFSIAEKLPIHPREQKLLEEFRQLDEPLKAWLFGAMDEKIQFKNMQTEINELKQKKLNE